MSLRNWLALERGRNASLVGTARRIRARCRFHRQTKPCRGAVALEHGTAFAQVEKDLFQHHVQRFAFVNVDVVLGFAVDGVEVHLVFRRGCSQVRQGSEWTDGAVRDELRNRHGQRCGKLGRGCTAARTFLVVEVPAVAALGAAAVRTTAQVHGFRGAVAKLAAVVAEARPGNAYESCQG